MGWGFLAAVLSWIGIAASEKIKEEEPYTDSTVNMKPADCASDVPLLKRGIHGILTSTPAYSEAHLDS